MENLAVSDTNTIFISYKRGCRYVKIAKLLHLITLIALVLFLVFGKMAITALGNGQGIHFFIYGCITAYGIILIVFAQLDALSRFQNYKLAKDLFFENGYKNRIVNLFVNSRCQREAIKIAAIDLNIDKELTAYYANLGYRWFDVIPDVVIQKPGILFTRLYWKNTLFINPYTSKYFLW
ncbi:MAG: hypothetical protein GY699_20000 [Desulfobacteraceae bacterium]|nr:hypothetical protein [Desulfobacteraceae bacterium]